MDKDSDSGWFYKYNMKWVLFISVGTFILAIIFSIITETSIERLSTVISFIVLLLIIIIGILFDTLGIAITKAVEEPFHSMASGKIKEANVAIRLIRNAGPVSNFCNDVVGDISGIMSGGIGTTLVFRIVQTYNIKEATIITILMTSFIASITVGGKALGKSVALIHHEQITLKMSKFIRIIEKIFNIEFFKKNKKVKRKANKNSKEK